MIDLNYYNIDFQYRNVYVVSGKNWQNNDVYDIYYKDKQIGQIYENHTEGYCDKNGKYKQNYYRVFKSISSIVGVIFKSPQKSESLYEFIKLSVDYYFDKGEKKIYNKIKNYKHFFYSYNNFKFDRTCQLFPQQYQVYYKNKYIGYIRCRHGELTFSDKPLGSKIFYSCDRDQSYDDFEAFDLLKKCSEKYLNYKENKL